MTGNSEEQTTSALTAMGTCFAFLPILLCSFRLGGWDGPELATAWPPWIDYLLVSICGFLGAFIANIQSRYLIAALVSGPIMGVGALKVNVACLSEVDATGSKILMFTSMLGAFPGFMVYVFLKLLIRAIIGRDVSEYESTIQLKSNDEEESTNQLISYDEEGCDKPLAPLPAVSITGPSTSRPWDHHGLHKHYRFEVKPENIDSVIRFHHCQNAGVNNLPHLHSEVTEKITQFKAEVNAKTILLPAGAPTRDHLMKVEEVACAWTKTPRPSMQRGLGLAVGICETLTICQAQHADGFGPNDQLKLNEILDHYSEYRNVNNAVIPLVQLDCTEI